MPIYNYVATDSAGARKVGEVDARTESLAVNLLKGQGLYVIDLTEKKDTLADRVLNFRGVPYTEIVTFTRQLSTMISSGLPLSRALEVLAEQTTQHTFKKALYDVLRDIEGGSSLSAALGRYPKIFNSTYQALVKAGESTGKLDAILKRLAETMEAERELSGKFKAAMIYPTIVFLAMIAVFILMMVVVVPKLANLYENLNVELPFITQVMINLSRFMTTYYVLIIAVLVVCSIGLRYYLKTDSGRDLISFLSYNLPVFGKINRQKDITQFTRTLGLLIGAAIPIVEALKIVANVVGNVVFKEATLEAAKYVEKGNSLSEFLKKSKAFPPVLGQMAAVGEETGQMDAIMDRISAYFDSEVDYLVKGLSSALEPIILIMLGTMVAVLIISIITPIYKITSAL